MTSSVKLRWANQEIESKIEIGEKVIIFLLRKYRDAWINIYDGYILPYLDLNVYILCKLSIFCEILLLIIILWRFITTWISK